MSYHDDLPALLAHIDAVTAPMPDLPPVPLLCARPGCCIAVIPALSPYCTPDCARRVATWARDPHAPTEFPPVELTAEEQALRDRLAERARLCRAQLPTAREADELLPDTLDDQDRAAIAHVTSALAQVPAEVARLKAAHRDELAALARARFNAPPMTAEEVTDALGLPVTVELHGSTPEAHALAAGALDELARGVGEEPPGAVDNRQAAFALQPSSTELAAIEEQIADQANRPWSHLPATPWDDPDVLAAFIVQERARRELAVDRALHEIDATDAFVAELLAKPRPRPRPPWWRRLAHALSTRKARP